jgi:hypothetical protein
VTENLELGVRVGWGLNENSPRFFSNAGVGGGIELCVTSGDLPTGADRVEAE